MAINKHAIQNLSLAVLKESMIEHGSIITSNATSGVGPLTGTFAFMDSSRPGTHVFKGMHTLSTTHVRLSPT